MPKVSVIIPICNAEKYLVQCIASVQNQTLKDIEIICVDDGSKDHSLDIIKDLASEDHRIVVIEKENSGYGHSVNMGIERATGQYIGIVESDDFISEKMYESLWTLSDNGTVDIVKGNFWDYYDWDNMQPEKVTNLERWKMPDVTGSFTIRQHPELLWGHPSVWSAIYRRDFLENKGITFMQAPGGGWVDNPFFFETLCCAKSIKWTKEPFYYYRKTNMNSSSNNQSDLTLPMRRMMDNLAVLEKYNFNDEQVLLFAYARALMYLCGAMEEKHYGKQMDKVRPYAQQMMMRINSRIIRENFHLGDQTNYYRYLSPLKLLMPTSGKILIYNWIPFDNPQKIGGGVTIYCRNLIETILKHRPDIQVYFLSSGWAYDMSTTECYIRKVNNVFGDRCRSFEIVNSPVPAAQNFLLNNPKLALESPTSKKKLCEFINDYGPFNVVHFNNIEGLSLDALELKRSYPNIHFVYSIHNYVPFCITGFYYQRHKKCNCNPNHTTADCLACTDVFRRHNLSSEILARAQNATPTEKQMETQKWMKYFHFEELDSIGDSNLFCEFSKRAVSVINCNMDTILAVSERVKEIAVENGMDAQKTHTSYIGTRIAENQIRCSAAPNSKYFKVAYLGSDINFEEKGYPFLLDTLSSINKTDASKIDLLLTTTNGNPEAIKKKLKQFHSVEVVNGYTHTDLKNLLKDVHLGVIPVLWEDNLPQIAIEMVAMGVPILCSSCGGASELCSSKRFQFQAGNKEDFIQHLLSFVNNPALVNEYWEHHQGLTTMDTHWEQLDSIFQIPRKENITVTLEQYSLLLEENDFLYNNLNCARPNLPNVYDSMSYRIGRMITFIPRKIRGLIQCYRDHGFTHTIHRAWEHILGKAL